MPRPCPRLLSLLLTLLPACGDGTSGTTSTATEATAAGTTAASTTDASGTTDASATAEPTTTGPGTSTAATTAASSTGVDTGGTTGAPVDCAGIPSGPFAPEMLWGGYGGSEDLAFDGAGGLALKRDGELVVVAADQQETVLVGGLPQVYGTRVAVDGTILLALPQQGKLQGVDMDGNVTDLAAGLEGPNGVYVDPAGAVWLTEFGGARVVRFSPDWQPVVMFAGPVASTANGIVFDPARGLLFFTNYAAGELHRLPIDQGMPAGMPELVDEVPGAKLDGLALDVCGNVYAVDQGNSRLYRFRLDGDGASQGEPEQLAEFPENVANAQFGRGPGFDADALYLSGNPGAVYRVAVGVAGAPIGLP